MLFHVLLMSQMASARMFEGVNTINYVHPGIGVQCEVRLYYGDNCNSGFWTRKFPKSLDLESGLQYINLGGTEENETDSVRVSKGCDNVEFWDEDADRHGYYQNFIVNGASGKGFKERTQRWDHVGENKDGYCFNLPNDLEEDLGGITVQWLGQCNMPGSPSFKKCPNDLQLTPYYGRMVDYVKENKVVLGVAASVGAVAFLVIAAARKVMKSSEEADNDYAAV